MFPFDRCVFLYNLFNIRVIDDFFLLVDRK